MKTSHNDARKNNSQRRLNAKQIMDNYARQKATDQFINPRKELLESSLLTSGDCDRIINTLQLGPDANSLINNGELRILFQAYVARKNQLIGNNTTNL